MLNQPRFATSIAITLVSLAIFHRTPSRILAQGEESVFQEQESGGGRSFGGAIQRIFGLREKPSEPASRSTPPPRGFKPGVFQGGIVRQLQSMTERPETSNVRVESVPSHEQTTAPVPPGPSQMAQRPPREPFSGNKNANIGQQRNPVPPRTSTPRDIFTEDPPSIVGTGVDQRKSVTARGEANAYDNLPRLPTANTPAPRTSPSVVPPNYNAYKNTAKPQSEEESPRVARKSIPGASTPSTPVVPPQSYAIPNNPYMTSSAQPNAVDASSRNQPKTTPAAAAANASPNSKAAAAGPANGNTKDVASANPQKPNTGSEARIEMGIPRVKLFVSGPSAIQVGKATPYEVIARNDGTEVLGGVIVSMTIPPSVKSSMPVATSGEFESEKDPAGTETLLWHVADLAPTQSRVFRVNLEATKAQHFGIDVEWTVLPQTGRIEVDVQQPQLTLALEGPSEVMWGKPEVYRMRVRNPGNAEAKDVEVRLTAEAFGSNQTKLGNIPAGSERIVEIELTFQHSGQIKIAGEAQSMVDTLESKSSIDVTVTQVHLASEWLSPLEQYQDSVAQHTLKVTNSSPIAADNVTCVAVLPSNFKAVSMPDGASLSGNEVRWTVPKITPNATVAFDFTLQAIESGPSKIQSKIECIGGGKAASESLVQIESVSDLKLSVTDPIAPAPVGQDVIYDLTIVNRGSKTAKAVKLLAQFSNGIEPVRVDGGSAKVLPGQVVFDPIESIEPGQEVTLRVVAQAAEPGMHRFRAELQCEESETQLIEEETTRYLATTRSDSTKTIRR